MNKLEVLLFTRHLATMIKSGITLSESLVTLSSQTKSGEFKRVIDAVINDVDNGQTLAKSFSKHNKYFDNFYISLIEISEESGSLDENLDFISKQLAKNYALANKIKTAMLYPSVILGAVIIMGGFISFFILPQLVNFFDAFEVELPMSTKILLFVANSFKDYGLYIGLALVLVGFLSQVIVRLKSIKPIWHAFLLKIPIIGNFLSDSQLAQFSRNLGALIKSGVHVSKAIEITAGTLSNLKFRNDLIKIGMALTTGKSIAFAMEQKKYSEFPALVRKMIEVGEKTGKLDESLLYLGDFYEEEIENTSKNLTTILEPILLVVIGLVVGFVALAIITPIYQLTGSIRR